MPRSEMTDKNDKYGSVTAFPFDTALSADDSSFPYVKDRVRGLLDHALLRADASSGEIISMCEDAEAFGAASVCVNTNYVPLCRRKLSGPESPLICATVGFPLGASATAVKVFEAETAVRAGADEICVAANIGWIKERADGPLIHEIQSVVRAAGRHVSVRLVIECPLLTDDEIVYISGIAARCKADAVQTSAGYGGRAASVRDVRLVYDSVKGRCGVCAAGGITGLKKAAALKKAGADRISSSSAAAIAFEEKENERKWREKNNRLLPEDFDERDRLYSYTAERRAAVADYYEKHVKLPLRKLWEREINGEPVPPGEREELLKFDYTQLAWDYDLEHFCDPDPSLIDAYITGRRILDHNELHYDLTVKDGVYHTFIAPAERLYELGKKDLEAYVRERREETRRSLAGKAEAPKEGFRPFTPDDSELSRLEVLRVIEKIEERNRILKKLSEEKKAEEFKRSDRETAERIEKERAERMRRRDAVRDHGGDPAMSDEFADKVADALIASEKREAAERAENPDGVITEKHVDPPSHDYRYTHPEERVRTVVTLPPTDVKKEKDGEKKPKGEKGDVYDIGTGKKL